MQEFDDHAFGSHYFKSIQFNAIQPFSTQLPTQLKMNVPLLNLQFNVQLKPYFLHMAHTASMGRTQLGQSIQCFQSIINNHLNLLSLRSSLKINPSQCSREPPRSQLGQNHMISSKRPPVHSQTTLKGNLLFESFLIYLSYNLRFFSIFSNLSTRFPIKHPINSSDDTTPERLS